MNPAYAFLAKKYARAFIAVNPKALDGHDRALLRELQKMLEKHHEILFFLNVTFINVAVINTAIDMMLEKFRDSTVLKKLLLLLVNEQRALLIPVVFASIISLYRERMKSAFFSIASSHQLDDASLKNVINFLERATNKKIEYEYSLDKKLIAGVRMQSDTQLWEHSIQQQLAAFKRSLADQGVLWN